MDNVRIRSNIPSHWYSSFEQLDQWQLDISTIARTHLLALRRQLQDYDNPPVLYLKEVSSWFTLWLQQLASGQLLNAVSLLQEIKSRYGGKKRGLDIAQQEASRRFNEARRSQNLDDHRLALTRRYVNGVYVCDYETVVTTGRVEGASAPLATLRERLNLLRPYIDKGIQNFGDQLFINPDVRQLKLLRQKRRKADDNYWNEVIQIQRTS